MSTRILTLAFLCLPATAVFAQDLYAPLEHVSIRVGGEVQIPVVDLWRVEIGRTDVVQETRTNDKHAIAIRGLKVGTTTILLFEGKPGTDGTPLAERLRSLEVTVTGVVQPLKK